MKKKIILITGNELRHCFVASKLASCKSIELKLVVHEKNNKLDNSRFYKKNKFAKSYIDMRKKTEILFFSKYIKNSKKYDRINIKNNFVNDITTINIIKKKKPDQIVIYGCSILSSFFIKKFKNKILNIHLGLSPYYKGAGTNFFPFVNNELQFCGSTIMEISKKIDSGRIAHQTRPNFNIRDNIHTIGNKIIRKTARDLCKIIVKKKIKFFRLKTKFKARIYKRKDFNIFTLKKAIYNLENNIIKNYVTKNKFLLEKKYPIIKQI